MVTVNDGEVRHETIEALDLRFASLRLPCPQAMARIREEMEQEGSRHPLLASDNVEEKKLVVIDGFKRLHVAQELGHTHVAVRVLHLSAVQAQVAILQENGPQRGLTDFEEGLVVQRLHRQHGMPQVEIGALLSRHKSWVCRRLELVEELESGVQEDLRLGLVSASVVRELVRLPRVNQRPTARAIAAHRLSSRQAARLVRVLSDAAPSQRKEILDAPLLHLPKERDAARAERDPRLSVVGNRIRQDLLQFRAASLQVVETLEKQDSSAFSAVQWELLGDIGKEATASAQEAVTCMERVLTPRTRREDETHRASAVAGV